MNAWNGIGNLVRDPELKTMPSGISVCEFTIAVNRKFANENGEHVADYINISTWRALADSCSKYLHKGSKVGIVGSIVTKSYINSNGEKRYKWGVNADTVEFLGAHDKTPTEPQKTAQNANSEQSDDMQPVNVDDLPF